MDQKPTKKIDLKKGQVAKLADKIAKSKSITFVDYHGLGAKAIGELRAKIKEAGGELAVTKNTLIARAMENSKLKMVNGKLLTGPTATVFAFEDEIATIKAVADLAKSLGFPKFKFGFFGKDLLNADSLNALSQIPPRDILLAKVVGALASPIYGLVSVLQANIRNLVYALDRVKQQKEAVA